MTATYDVTPWRSNVKAYLVNALRDALPTIEVSDGWPGSAVEDDHVWAEYLTGSLTLPYIEAGEKTVDDAFEVTFVFRASGEADTIAETDARCETYARTLVAIIAADPSLDGMVELMLTTFDDNSMEGPVGSFTDVGAQSLARVKFNARARSKL